MRLHKNNKKEENMLQAPTAAAARSLARSGNFIAANGEICTSLTIYRTFLFFFSSSYSFFFTSSPHISITYVREAANVFLTRFHRRLCLHFTPALFVAS